MMLNYNGLLRLKDIPPEKEFWTGALFRMYNVGCLDAKRTKDDYYDLMLVDISFLAEDSLAMVNITLNSDNRGRIVAIIRDVSCKYYVNAAALCKYFSPEVEIYYIEDAELLKKP